MENPRTETREELQAMIRSDVFLMNELLDAALHLQVTTDELATVQRAIRSAFSGLMDALENRLFEQVIALNSEKNQSSGDRSEL